MCFLGPNTREIPDVLASSSVISVFMIALQVSVNHGLQLL